MLGRRCRATLGIQHLRFSQTQRGYRWIFLGTHCLVMLLLGGDCVQARSWRDVLSDDDIKLSLRGRSGHHSRPGELSFEIEKDPFHFPSPTINNVNHNSDENGEIDGEDTEGPASEISTFADGSGSDLKSDNIFERLSSSSIARKRDIRTYGDREFIPPTESPALEISSSAREGSSIASSTENTSSHGYPEDSTTPMHPPPLGYFNYDTSQESWYGPGYPVISNSDRDDLVVDYANNAWIEYEPPPPISPEEAMAMANNIASDGDYHNYFYWDEFGPEGLGFGPWKDSLRNLRTTPNQCGNIGRQSPIDVRPNGVACLEHHQIRSRKGDFRIFGNRYTLDLWILSSKLRVRVRRRPCRDIENPVCSEPDPPHADFPHGWPGFADVLHVDFKFPSEHRIHGRAFDGEMQIYHLHPGRRRLPVVSVLMKVGGGEENDSDWNVGHNEYLQEAIDGFQYEYDSNLAKCAKTAIDRENRRLQMIYHGSKKYFSSDMLRQCDASRNHKSAATGDGSTESQGPSFGNCYRNEEKRGEVYGDQSIEELANTTFGGSRERLKQYAGLMEQDSSFAIQKENHRRRLSGIWNPHHTSLVPSIYFYGYDGSLTEPPCSEIVSWFVIDEPMSISRNQLEQMKTLLFTNIDGATCQATSVHYQSSVARPIQDTGLNRQIWHCTPNEFLPD